jgi:tetratricopeptide (TPR) repeat protein
MNQYDQAISASQMALALAPDYASVYDNLGMTYAGLQDSSRATQNFEKAIEIDKKQKSNDEWPLVDYGAYLESAQESTKAEVVLKEALQMNPVNATANFELGRTMQQLEKNAEAENYLTETIKLDPTYTQAYYILSGLVRKRGDRALAATYLEKYQKLKEQEKKEGSSSTVLSMRHR